ncbi:imidazoleglycerol-phosphate dehydratase [Lottiidibacillus patelloidae]|uniref:Imidazoleglycerol-phosphate dehydratase n=1 Tax=Lottiidibacillus patelloidae TaxID=2670334 RepID=A0A263BX24_9BACI|nr:imidazoleglycerol-phosphate dehydratase [Lottiidibacillus patelloidae]OZM58112.1 imidazoleglycerol-phosphate dehydratase [Lottiidibacillus patelloidae]
MTSRNGSKGSKNQNAPDAEFSRELSSGDNNKGNDYRSKKGSKSQLKHPNNH